MKKKTEEMSDDIRPNYNDIIYLYSQSGLVYTLLGHSACTPDLPLSNQLQSINNPRPRNWDTV